MGIAVGVILLVIFVYMIGNGFAKSVAQAINGTEKVAKTAPVVAARTITSTTQAAAKTINTGAVVAGVGVTKAKIKAAQLKGSSTTGFQGFLSKVKEEMAEIKSTNEVDEARAARVEASRQSA